MRKWYISSIAFRRLSDREHRRRYSQERTDQSLRSKKGVQESNNKVRQATPRQTAPQPRRRVPPARGRLALPPRRAVRARGAPRPQGLFSAKFAEENHTLLDNLAGDTGLLLQFFCISRVRSNEYKRLSSSGFVVAHPLRRIHSKRPTFWRKTSKTDRARTEVD